MTLVVPGRVLPDAAVWPRVVSRTAITKAVPRLAAPAGTVAGPGDYAGAGASSTTVLMSSAAGR
jgi:hypothetical protein